MQHQPEAAGLAAGAESDCRESNVKISFAIAVYRDDALGGARKPWFAGRVPALGHLLDCAIPPEMMQESAAMPPFCRGFSRSDRH
jgi:hypothetical protein